jgi:hypothetical protein
MGGHATETLKQLQETLQQLQDSRDERYARELLESDHLDLDGETMHYNLNENDIDCFVSQSRRNTSVEEVSVSVFDRRRSR